MLDESLIDLLKQHHKDELEDVNAYNELSNKLSQAGFYHEAGILHDIAADEDTHARVIQEILTKTSY